MAFIFLRERGAAFSNPPVPPERGGRPGNNLRMIFISYLSFEIIWSEF
jgi:hypothetical protein